MPIELRKIVYMNRFRKSDSTTAIINWIREKPQTTI